MHGTLGVQIIRFEKVLTDLPDVDCALQQVSPPTLHTHASTRSPTAQSPPSSSSPPHTHTHPPPFYPHMVAPLLHGQAESLTVTVAVDRIRAPKLKSAINKVERDEMSEMSEVSTDEHR